MRNSMNGFLRATRTHWRLIQKPHLAGEGRLLGFGGGKISSRMIFQSSMLGGGLWSTRQGLETWALFSWLGDLG